LALFDDLSDRAALEPHLAVSLFDTYGVTQALIPLLTRPRRVIVNVLSVAALSTLPIVPAYSISKAAAFSQSQSRRTLLAGRGVRVHAVLAGPTRICPRLRRAEGLSGVRTQAVFDEVGKGEEDIFPDPMSESMAESWRSGAVMALERQFATLVEAVFLQ
jgi:NAD(P)-dependent dehydrogenase (short-subunit alcohol dehydrogenase family)